MENHGKSLEIIGKSLEIMEKTMENPWIFP